MQIGAYILTLLVAYLIGSIPTGYLAGRLRGVDVRAAGSGNIGATNVLRVLGKTAGTCVLLADALKGFAATKGVPLLAAMAFGAGSVENLALVAGLAAVLGHVYPCWLKFKGGKGIATSAGVGLAWAPAALLTALAAWGIAFVCTKYVSVASLVAAVVLPLAVWLFQGGPKMTVVMTGISLLAIYKHKGNIRRLLEGTENRAGRPKSQSST